MHIPKIKKKFYCSIGFFELSSQDLSSSFLKKKKNKFLKKVKTKRGVIVDL